MHTHEVWVNALNGETQIIYPGGLKPSPERKFVAQYYGDLKECLNWASAWRSGWMARHTR